MSYPAELVHTETADGLTLVGTLRPPAVSHDRQLGVDVIVLHHGVGGNFYRGALFDQISEALLAAGCAVLRVNNRGHDLMSNEQRRGKIMRAGAAFETVADCVPDWRAWIDFAEAQGFQRIGVWGHSLGGVKTIYYLSTEDDARVVYAVASSPPRFAYELYVVGPDAEEFRQQFGVAQVLVDQGEGQTLLDATMPIRAVLAADTYVDKYGPADRYDIAWLLPNVRAPLLVTVGALEATGPQRISFAHHEATIGPLAAAQANLAFDVVAGADHFYTGVEANLWEAVRRWEAGARTAAVTP